ncbi:MAG: hypothetical protein V2J19_01960 [Wenzhouxiangella sp.]|nr:hypothetical protein [Wenzhouxiangella sp.]
MTKYLLCWFLLAAVGVVNGVLRQYTYGRRLPELAAHQISTVTAILFTGLVVLTVSRFWPLASMGQAWLVGAIWLAATVAFEFGFGHYVVGHPWEKLLRDYNLKRGRLWLLVLVWILVMPPLFHAAG